MNSIIIACAGRGERFGAGRNKLLVPVSGKPLIWHTLHHVLQSLFLDEIILVVRGEERKEFEEIVFSIPHRIPIRFAEGGETRQDSVASGLVEVSPDSDILLIHDGARPGVPGEAFDRLISEITDETPAALFTLPETDTVKRVGADGFIEETVPRETLRRAQTPQGAKTKLFRACMEKILEKKLPVTDDASILEACGVRVKCVSGKESYFKMTVPEDEEKANQVLGQNLPRFRVGEGYDIHRFDPSRPLILGGVRISETGGLLGHSDADVLIHAVMDALLGAAGCPDIGHYFPDNDDRFLGISSLVLLGRVAEILAEKGYAVGNIDSTVIAEAPKLAPHIPAMREKLAEALQISPEQINIKVTTNEKLGAIGRKEGIAALATALVYRV